MTCIVGIARFGVVHIGGDSAGVSGLDLTVRADPKVFRNGPFVMGFTTSFRMGQLLRFAFTPPEHPEGLDDYAFMVTRFIDGVRECLKAGGYAKKDNEVEQGGQFLVGYRGQLYEVGSDYQVAIPAYGFAAIGCGADLALGALHALSPETDHRRILNALEAAATFNAGVCGPFTIISPDPQFRSGGIIVSPTSDGSEA